MNSRNNNESKVVIVTGGGRGIGASTCRLLAANGYSVAINFLKNTASAQLLCNEIESSGGKAFICQADVSVESEVKKLFVAVKDQYGPVTHLVNNAGVLFTQAPITEITAARFENVFKANVMSCFLCSKEFINQVVGPGAIVNVSSLASKTGAAFEYIDYAATKGAMDTLTKGMAAEFASKNIRVNGVRPGFIYTDIHADGGEPGRVDRLAPQIPLQRGGTPEEVAQSIAWLLSDEASYVSGTSVNVAGGR